MTEVEVHSPEEFARSLRILRKARNLTQLDLAAQLGVSTRTVTVLERRCPYNTLVSTREIARIQPSLAMMVKLSRILGVRFVIQAGEEVDLHDAQVPGRMGGRQG